MANQFKVTTEVLKEQSDRVSETIESIKTYFEEAKSTVESIGSYWEGDTAQKYTRMYADIEEDVLAVLSRWKEHISDLRTMAGVYEEAESSAQSLSAQLPNDIL